MGCSLLEAHGIQKRFGAMDQELVLRDITVSFCQGKSYAIMGVSGTGKSTLMHLLAGLDTPTKGEILFNGQSLHQMNALEHDSFLRTCVGLLFQLPYLIRELSVIENILLPALIAGHQKESSFKKARQLLDSMGLAQKTNDLPGSLSGGQQQRVALARALINEPAFLLADEPTGNLDERTAKEMVDLLLQLQHEWQMGLIVSTHDRELAHRMDFRYQLHEGRLGDETAVEHKGEIEIMK